MPVKSAWISSLQNVTRAVFPEEYNLTIKAFWDPLGSDASDALLAPARPVPLSLCPSAAGKMSLTDARGFKRPSLLLDPVHGPLLQPAGNASRDNFLCA